MKGYYAIYNHRSNCWYSSSGNWMEDSDTNKEVQNIQCYMTLSAAEEVMINGMIPKYNYKDFFTIRKIYF